MTYHLHASSQIDLKPTSHFCLPKYLSILLYQRPVTYREVLQNTSISQVPVVVNEQKSLCDACIGITWAANSRCFVTIYMEGCMGKGD